LFHGGREKSNAIQKSVSSTYTKCVTGTFMLQFEKISYFGIPYAETQKILIFTEQKHKR
jgi:hypothetical protein